ncbi:MAG: hypothetical protein NC311_03705 [Muribaculaceae bacterium]|nr:hypothetical protein [Muribaculaceae bacterium]
MSKNKIVFAGVMGAILMSAGANAATTSVATKGYVDQQVKGVQTTVSQLGDTYATIESVTGAINDLNLSETYEALTNKVNAISNTMSAEEKATKYPTVGAVLDAMPSLTDADKEAIKDLTGENGLITRVETIESTIKDLTGDGENSVAQQIADALDPYSTTAESNAAYQVQSTAAYSVGNADGEWEPLSSAQVAALDSGITKEIVANTAGAITNLQSAIVGLNGTDGTDGTIAEIENTIKELQSAIDGLNGADGVDGTITTIEKTIADLQKAIDGLNGKDGVDGTITTIEKTITELQEAINDETNGLAAKVENLTEQIADKISNPPTECVSESGACVLMINEGSVSWVQVTKPLEYTGASAGE